MKRRKPAKNPAARKNQQAAPSQQNHVTRVTQSYSGPIPTSIELSNYDSVVPGAAERIIRMAEKSQDHQIDIERTAINAQKWEGRIGQVFALIVALAAFGTAISAMVMGHAAVAGVIAGTTVVSLAVAFITGRAIS